MSSRPSPLKSPLVLPKPSLPLNSSRFGLPAPGSVITFGVAVLMIADVTCAALADGLRSRTVAAAPATCGDAIDVPDMVAVAVSFAMPAETMSTPGAYRSVQVPKFDNDARRSLMSLAAVVMAVAARAGDVRQASRLKLPAATTTVKPAAVARATAASSESVAPYCRLMLMTPGRCPLATTQSRPAAAWLVSPLPEQLITRTPCSRTRFATPQVFPPIVPATCEPWPWQSRPLP